MDLDWRTDSDAIRVEFLDQKLVETFPDPARDLLEIAYSVYASDRLVSRGQADVLGDQWRRSMTIRVPVREKDLWSSLAESGDLREPLGFLSDDHWTFQFVPYKRRSRTQRPVAEAPFRDRTCVSLFSGGLDSLAGAAQDHIVDGHRPLLISHRSQHGTQKRQRKLYEGLDRGSGAFARLPFWVQIRRDEREATQRTRTFLYLSAAAVVAHQIGVPTVHIFENGPISINLPISAQVVGTRASRTTHPRAIGLMQSLLDRVLGTGVKLELPFLSLTKTDVVQVLRGVDRLDLLATSSSCTRTRWQAVDRQHCGICSQCIDRRVAVEAAGVAHLDPTYVHDIFTDPLSKMPRENDARSLIEGYLRTYLEFSGLSDEEIFDRYASEISHLYGHVPDEYIEKLPLLYRRHAEQLLGVVEARIGSHASELLRGKLPDDAVLQILLRDKALAHGPQERFADRVTEIAGDVWRTVFSGRHPAGETELHRELEGAFSVVKMEMDREHPLFRFVPGVSTKPDFSDPRRPFWVEVKYLHAGGRGVREITEDILKDLAKYRVGAELALFLVYDPDRLIKEPERFIRELQPKAGALIRVI